MPHIAGLRGVLPEASKVGETIGKPVELAKGLAAGSLVRDPGRAVYRYHTTFAGPGRTLTRKSFVCAVRLAPWSEGMVRPHETVSDEARAAALELIKANQAHTRFVLAGVRDSAGEVDRVFRRVDGLAPTLQITTADGVQHSLWRVQDAEVIGKLRNYFTPKKLHVLDGHDTYEGMLAYQAELAAKQEPSNYSSANYGLFCIVPFEDQALVAAARHKVVRGLTAKSEEVLAAAKKHFIVEKLAGAAGDVGKLLGAISDSVAHQPTFVAVFAGEPDAWKLTLSPEVSPVHEGVTVHRSMAKLDPVVVEHMFLRRLLPGAQVATDTDAKRALGAGGQLTLIVRAMSIEQIAHVDEIGQTLPSHSTAIFPPLANGLVSLVIDPDEDLV
ncbi:MAG: DUF1015 family protein [Myxococcales bacterium]|nr:DUF1015 family protein [Myxococcales bacterium]